MRINGATNFSITFLSLTHWCLTVHKFYGTWLSCVPTMICHVLLKANVFIQDITYKNGFSPCCPGAAVPTWSVAVLGITVCVWSITGQCRDTTHIVLCKGMLEESTNSSLWINTFSSGTYWWNHKSVICKHISGTDFICRRMPHGHSGDFSTLPHEHLLTQFHDAIKH